MNDERNGDNGERGLLGRIAQALSLGTAQP
jgi:hypothetical protein